MNDRTDWDSRSVGFHDTDDHQRWLLEQKQAEVERLRAACSKLNDEVCQTLGKALGYPGFKDNPATFPNATEADGVCVGDHVAESIAAEAAKKIGRLRAEVEQLRADVSTLMQAANEEANEAEQLRVLLRDTQVAVKALRGMLGVESLTRGFDVADNLLARIKAALAKEGQ